jgi:Transglycosylase
MRSAERKVVLVLGAGLLAAPVAGALLVIGLYQYGVAAHPGVALADTWSRQHARDQDVSPDGLGQVATAGWLTRNASADRVIDGLVATAEWGHGRHGVDDAARGYFAKPASALSASEAAVLAAALTDAANRSRGVDPWCAPAEAAARNRVLRRMAANGAVASRALQALVQGPVGVVERRCQ